MLMFDHKFSSQVSQGVSLKEFATYSCELQQQQASLGAWLPGAIHMCESATKWYWASFLMATILIFHVLLLVIGTCFAIFFGWRGKKNLANFGCWMLLVECFWVIGGITVYSILTADYKDLLNFKPFTFFHESEGWTCSTGWFVTMVSWLATAVTAVEETLQRNFLVNGEMRDEILVCDP